MSNSKGKASASRPTSRSPRINSKGSASLRDVSNSEEKRKIVGQYMFGKTIGEGTFGKVRLAIHIPTGEKVSKHYFWIHKLF
jgi:serine/threonine protein kinase